jgi:hypothetical protein
VESRKLAKQTGQHVLGDGSGGAKCQLPGMLSAQRGNFMFSLDEERIRLLRISQKNLSRLRQRDLRAGAIEELDAKIFLQRLDLETHRGLRQIQLFRGLTKAALFRNCPEDYQAEVVETRHE